VCASHSLLIRLLLPSMLLAELDDGGDDDGGDDDDDDDDDDDRMGMQRWRRGKKKAFVVWTAPFGSRSTHKLAGRFDCWPRMGRHATQQKAGKGAAQLQPDT